MKILLLLLQLAWRPEMVELRYHLVFRPGETDAIITYAEGFPRKACLGFYSNGDSNAESPLVEECWKPTNQVADIVHFKVDAYTCNCFAVARTETPTPKGVRYDEAWPVQEVE